MQCVAGGQIGVILGVMVDVEIWLLDRGYIAGSETTAKFQPETTPTCIALDRHPEKWISERERPSEY